MHLLSPSPCCIIGGAGRPPGRGARSRPSPLRLTGMEPGGRCTPQRPTGCPCSHHHQGHHSDGPAALIHVPDCTPTQGIMPIPTAACGSGCTGTRRLARRPESHGGHPNSSSSSGTITARGSLLSAAAVTLGWGWLAQGAAAAAAATASTSEPLLPSVLPLDAESAASLAARQVTSPLSLRGGSSVYGVHWGGACVLAAQQVRPLP